MSCITFQTETIDQNRLRCEQRRGIEAIYTEEDDDIRMTMSTSDDTVAMLERDAQDACGSIFKDMMFMGHCEDMDFDDDDDIHDRDIIWDGYYPDDIDNGQTPATKTRPLVVVNREERPQTPTFRTTRKSIDWRRSCSSAGRRKPTATVTTSAANNKKDFDVVFVNQDKYASVHGIEVCASNSNKIGDLYVSQAMTLFNRYGATGKRSGQC